MGTKQYGGLQYDEFQKTICDYNYDTSICMCMYMCRDRRVSDAL